MRVRGVYVNVRVQPYIRLRLRENRDLKYRVRHILRLRDALVRRSYTFTPIVRLRYTVRCNSFACTPFVGCCNPPHITLVCQPHTCGQRPCSDVSIVASIRHSIVPTRTSCSYADSGNLLACDIPGNSRKAPMIVKCLRWW